jgi:transketolase C-terminal domain/subunit
MTAPIITLVEAKNDCIVSGLGQCIAEMVAANIFNTREGIQLSTMYGVVTTGNIWKFLKLEHNNVYIDLQDYYIIQADKIVSILISMVNESAR